MSSKRADSSEERGRNKITLSSGGKFNPFAMPLDTRGLKGSADGKYDLYHQIINGEDMVVFSVGGNSIYDPSTKKWGKSSTTL